MKTIVVLVDFSSLSFKLMKQAHALAKAFGSHVILLHVVPLVPTTVDFGLVSPTVMEEPPAEAVRSDLEKLTEMRDSLAKFGVNATTSQFQGGAADDVLDEIKRMDADLIIVGSHGHGAFYELVVGSVTKNVLKHPPCPVLVVPEGYGEAA